MVVVWHVGDEWVLDVFGWFRTIWLFGFAQRRGYPAVMRGSMFSRSLMLSAYRSAIS